MQFESQVRPRRGLRLAPLIDVVFLLLVFFMLAARLEHPLAIAVNAPAEAGGGAFTGSVLVRLGADGGVDLAGVQVGMAGLAAAVAPYLERDRATGFLVQPAAQAPIASLVQVLDRLQGAGVEKLTLLEAR